MALSLLLLLLWPPRVAEMVLIRAILCIFGSLVQILTTIISGGTGALELLVNFARTSVGRRELMVRLVSVELRKKSSRLKRLAVFVAFSARALALRVAVDVGFSISFDGGRNLLFGLFLERKIPRGQNGREISIGR